MMRLPLPFTGPLVAPEPDTICTLTPLNCSVVPSNDPSWISVALHGPGARIFKEPFRVFLMQMTPVSACVEGTGKSTKDNPSPTGQSVRFMFRRLLWRSVVPTDGAVKITSASALGQADRRQQPRQRGSPEASGASFCFRNFPIVSVRGAGAMQPACAPVCTKNTEGRSRAERDLARRAHIVPRCPEPEQKFCAALIQAPSRAWHFT